MLFRRSCGGHWIVTPSVPLPHDDDFRFPDRERLALIPLSSLASLDIQHRQDHSHASQWPYDACGIRGTYNGYDSDTTLRPHYRFVRVWVSSIYHRPFIRWFTDTVPFCFVCNGAIVIGAFPQFSDATWRQSFVQTKCTHRQPQQQRLL